MEHKCAAAATPCRGLERVVASPKRNAATTLAVGRARYRRRRRSRHGLHGRRGPHGPHGCRWPRGGLHPWASSSSAHAAGKQERVRATALAWERVRTTVDVVARRVAEAEHYLVVTTGQQPIIPFTDAAASSSHQAPPATSGSWLAATDLMVAQLHL